MSIIQEFNFSDRNKLPELLNHMGLLGRGAEIGTFKGHFSKTILSGWSGDLHMIDVWRELSVTEYDDMSNHKNHVDAYSEAMDNIRGFEDRAFMLRMKGKYGSSLFMDNSLDFVYIDANHTYEGVKEDISYWYSKVKPGGLMLGHDYLPDNFYSDGQKDIPLMLFSETSPEPTYAGMFGVNPAVDEFVSENNYILYKTEEFLGTWAIIKR